MAAGGIAITSCFGYIYYMRMKATQSSEGETYVAVTESGEEHLVPKKSKWD